MGHKYTTFFLLFFLNTVNYKCSIFFFQIRRVPGQQLRAVLIQEVLLQKLLSEILNIRFIILSYYSLLLKVIHEIYPTLNDFFINAYACLFSGVKAGVGFKHILIKKLRNCFTLILSYFTQMCQLLFINIIDFSFDISSSPNLI